MKVGISEIAKDARYGMSELHMQGLRLAAENVGPIGIRPVSPYARSYLQEGCPTKPFAVKNKSANLGIAAGLIPIDPAFGRTPESEYGKHVKQLNDAFHKDSDLQPIPLVVTEEKLRELASVFGEKMDMQMSGANEYTISWQKEGEKIEVKAIKNAAGTYDILQDNEPVLVLGKKVKGANGEALLKPITADYDLLVVCPPYSEFDPGGKDQLPFRTQGILNTSVKENISKVAASESKDYEGKKEHAKGGNWSERIESAVNTINIKIGEMDILRKGQSPTVHHNAEFANPFADDLKNNVPCLIVLPKKMDISTLTNQPGAKEAEMVLIETPQEMSKMRDFLRDAGYYWPAHAKYKDDIKPFREESVAATSKAVEMMQRTQKLFSKLYEAKNEGQQQENKENQENAVKKKTPDIKQVLEEHGKRKIGQLNDAIENDSPFKMRRR